MAVFKLFCVALHWVCVVFHLVVWKTHREGARCACANIYWQPPSTSGTSSNTSGTEVEMQQIISKLYPPLISDAHCYCCMRLRYSLNITYMKILMYKTSMCLGTRAKNRTRHSTLSVPVTSYFWAKKELMISSWAPPQSICSTKKLSGQLSNQMIDCPETNTYL